MIASSLNLKARHVTCPDGGASASLQLLRLTTSRAVRTMNRPNDRARADKAPAVLAVAESSAADRTAAHE